MRTDETVCATPSVFTSKIAQRGYPSQSDPKKGIRFFVAIATKSQFPLLSDTTFLQPSRKIKKTNSDVRGSELVL